MELKDYIDKHGRNEICKRVGVSIMALSYWYRGIKKPDIKSIVRLVETSKGELTLKQFTQEYKGKTE